ncbi:MAG: hypothetical protein J2P16_04995 [Mycobacterium sp.]|nr:hypothetical protein [Mycobacterium sp.]
MVEHTERSPITFSVAAGCHSAAHRMHHIVHRRLQIIGLGMGVGVALIGVIPGLTTMPVPFLALSGIVFFLAFVAAFGPTTAFGSPSECYPIGMRTTGHGNSAGVATAGAFNETTEPSLDHIFAQRVVAEAERILQTSDAAVGYSRT